MGKTQSTSRRRVGVERLSADAVKLQVGKMRSQDIIGRILSI